MSDTLNEKIVTILDDKLEADCPANIMSWVTSPSISQAANAIELLVINEIDCYKKEAKAANKETKAIKEYISKMRKDALKNHGENFNLLVFIQRLEESFTWVRNI